MTPIERRLREMADTRRRLVVSQSDADAIDAGREALALLRRHDTALAAINSEGATGGDRLEYERVVCQMRDLLARCGEQEGT